MIYGDVLRTIVELEGTSDDVHIALDVMTCLLSHAMASSQDHSRLKKEDTVVCYRTWLEGTAVRGTLLAGKGLRRRWLSCHRNSDVAVQIDGDQTLMTLSGTPHDVRKASDLMEWLVAARGQLPAASGPNAHLSNAAPPAWELPAR